MSTVTDPSKPERGVLDTCPACGVVFHIHNGRDCDCDLSENDDL